MCSLLVDGKRHIRCSLVCSPDTNLSKIRCRPMCSMDSGSLACDPNANGMAMDIVCCLTDSLTFLRRRMSCYVLVPSRGIGVGGGHDEVFIAYHSHWKSGVLHACAFDALSQRCLACCIGLRGSVLVHRDISVVDVFLVCRGMDGLDKWIVGDSFRL